MSRGERARSERTDEERQRAREERERRRAERGGGEPVAGAHEPGSVEPLVPEAVAPEDFVPEAASEPVSPEAVVPEAEPGPGPVPAEAVVPEAVAPELASEPLLPEAIVPERASPEPIVPEPDTEAFEALPAAIEPSAVAEPHEPVAEPEREHDPEPEPAEAAMATEGQPEEESPPSGLPPAPRRIASSPSRGRRSGAGGGGRPPGGRREPRERRVGGTPHVSRVVAIGALVVVAIAAVAVVLAVHSLKGSKSKAPVAAPVVKVLIPEGKTRLQIAEVAKAAGLKGDYRTAARSSDLLDPTQYGAPKGTPDLEGFLFPATYELDKGASVSRLVAEQLEAFSEHFSSEYVARAKALHETPYQLLIVASMVEREAQVPGDRAKIAAVIYNRLAKGMPVGIDAAIYYAVEEAKNIPTYTGELTSSDLKINSPYNTRTHTGLPPTPISNPGVASLQAAAHPAKVSYLFYVAGADGCGEQVFSDTEAQFEANAKAYEEAKRRNGGKPPKCKHG